MENSKDKKVLKIPTWNIFPGMPHNHVKCWEVRELEHETLDVHTWRWDVRGFMII